MDPGRTAYRNWFPRRGHTGSHFVSRSGRVRYDPQYKSYRSRARGFFGSQKLWSGIAGLAGVLAFFQQLTSNDFKYGQSYFNGLTTTDKIKWFVSKSMGRLTGINPFPQVAGTLQPKLNPGGMLNQWTGLGISGLIYGMLPFRLPAKSKARKLGGALMIGGVLGGLFDPSLQEMQQSGQLQASSSNNQPMVTNSTGSIWGKGS
jgi:hypothetical protein